MMIKSYRLPAAEPAVGPGTGSREREQNVPAPTSFPVGRHCRAAIRVPQTSKSAVSRVSQPAAHPNTGVVAILCLCRQFSLSWGREPGARADVFPPVGRHCGAAHYWSSRPALLKPTPLVPHCATESLAAARRMARDGSKPVKPSQTQSNPVKPLPLILHEPHPLFPPAAIWSPPRSSPVAPSQTTFPNPPTDQDQTSPSGPLPPPRPSSEFRKPTRKSPGQAQPGLPVIQRGCYFHPSEKP